MDSSPGTHSPGHMPGESIPKEQHSEVSDLARL